MSKTYVMGRAALFNRAILNPTLSDGTYLWHLYESNWRVLHIDGFEPGYGSRTIRFRWSQRAVLGGFSDKTAQEKVAEL